MDTSEMQELLRGYLNEMDWANGVTKDDLMAHLAGRDDALRTMLNEYVVEGTYRTADDVMTLVPAQAWQDVQGDTWRGAESQYVEDVDSNFQAGPVGQAEGEIYRAGDPAPPTPGFGRSAGVQGGGTAAAGGGGDTLGGGGQSGAPATGATAGDAGDGGLLVDATVVGVDVTGDGIADAVVVDAVVIDPGGSGQADAEGTGSGGAGGA